MNPKNGIQEGKNNLGINQKGGMQPRVISDSWKSKWLNAKQGMKTVNCRGFQSVRNEESRHQADSERHSNLRVDR